jgi:hypothetical protein
MVTGPDGTDTAARLPGAEADDRERPALPDDPRVPRPEDAAPTAGKELGGAAPPVGPGAG